MRLHDLFLEFWLVNKPTKRNQPRYHCILSQESRSFLKQWVQHVLGTFLNTTISTLDITNTPRNTILTQLNAPAATSVWGLLLGTGDTAVTITDYKLQTLIAHGSGASQLDHKAVILEAVTVVSNVASFKIKRQFENLSGSAIIIKESGLVDYYAGSYATCIVRDVLVSPLTIEAGQIIEARYIFKATA